MKTLDEHFEAIRKEIENLIDIFPLTSGQLLDYSDLLDAVSRLEQSYRRVAIVKRKSE